MHQIKKLNMPVFAAIFLSLGAIGVTTFFEIKDDKEQPLIFPNALAYAKESVAINIDSSDTVTTLVKAGSNAWFVGELEGYPADISKINAFIKEIASLKLKDIASSNPARFIEFGVENVSPESPSRRVSFINLSGEEILGFIATPYFIEGNDEPNSLKEDKKNKSDALPDDVVFLRKDGRSNVLESTGKLLFDSNPLWWVNNKIINIEPNDIETITLTDLATSPEEIMVFSRNKNSDSNPPETYTVSYNFAFSGNVTSEDGERITEGLNNLYFNQVRQTGNIKESMETIFKLEAKLKDYSIIGLNFVKVGENEVWLEVSSSESAINGQHKGWLYNVGWDNLLAILPPPEEDKENSETEEESISENTESENKKPE